MILTVSKLQDTQSKACPPQAGHPWMRFVQGERAPASKLGTIAFTTSYPLSNLSVLPDLPDSLPRQDAAFGLVALCCPLPPPNFYNLRGERRTQFSDFIAKR